MRDPDALGMPRRARGVHLVGELHGGGDAGERRRRDGGASEVPRRENGGRSPAADRDATLVVRDAKARAGVRLDPPNALGRLAQVERHVDPARPDDPEHGDDELEGRLEPDGDPLLPPQPVLNQRGRQRLGRPIQLTVREATVAVLQRLLGSISRGDRRERTIQRLPDRASDRFAHFRHDLPALTRPGSPPSGAASSRASAAPA